MTQAPCDYPESAGSEPLPFLPAVDANVMGREIVYHYAMWDYGYLDDWPLGECTHPIEWLVIPLHMADFIKIPAQGRVWFRHFPVSSRHLQFQVRERGCRF